MAPPRNQQREGQELGFHTPAVHSNYNRLSGRPLVASPDSGFQSPTARFERNEPSGHPFIANHGSGLFNDTAAFDNSSTFGGTISSGAAASEMNIMGDYTLGDDSAFTTSPDSFVLAGPSNYDIFGGATLVDDVTNWPPTMSNTRTRPPTLLPAFGDLPTSAQAPAQTSPAVEDDGLKRNSKSWSVAESKMLFGLVKSRKDARGIKDTEPFTKDNWVFISNEMALAGFTRSVIACRNQYYIRKKTYPRPWKCPEESCEYRRIGWNSKSILDRHYQEKHFSAPRRYQCIYEGCKFASRRKHGLEFHVEKVHN